MKKSECSNPGPDIEVFYLQFLSSFEAGSPLLGNCAAPTWRTVRRNSALSRLNRHKISTHTSSYA